MKLAKRFDWIILKSILKLCGITSFNLQVVYSLKLGVIEFHFRDTTNIANSGIQKKMSEVLPAESLNKFMSELTLRRKITILSS